MCMCDQAPGALGAKAAGKRTPALAQHVDIMPTLIDLAGLPIDVGDETPLSGVSLKPVRARLRVRGES